MRLAPVSDMPSVTFPLIMLIAFMPSVADWYAVTTLAPTLERELGFSAAVGRHPAWSRPDTFFITEVKAGGIFDRAGFKPGDVPVDVHHGRGDFYKLLESHRGQSIDLRVLRISPGPTDTFLVEHRLKVLVPRPAAPDSSVAGTSGFTVLAGLECCGCVARPGGGPLCAR